jgi:MraZ protein
MRFRGISKLSVDAKGRLAMPKNHRENLEHNKVSELVVTVDLSGCLLIYPRTVWLELEEHLNALPNSSPSARKIQRMFIGFATDVELDGAGRMLLSAELRDYAGIGRKAVLIGQGKKFELWDEDAWQKETESWEEIDLNQAGLPADLQRLSI